MSIQGRRFQAQLDWSFAGKMGWCKSETWLEYPVLFESYMLPVWWTWPATAFTGIHPCKERKIVRPHCSTSRAWMSTMTICISADNWWMMLHDATCCLIFCATTTQQLACGFQGTRSFISGHLDLYPAMRTRDLDCCRQSSSCTQWIPGCKEGLPCTCVSWLIVANVESRITIWLVCIMRSLDFRFLVTRRHRMLWIRGTASPACLRWFADECCETGRKPVLLGDLNMGLSWLDLLVLPPSDPRNTWLCSERFLLFGEDWY